MTKQKTSTVIKAGILSMVLLGVATLAVSAYLMSSFFAIVGFSLMFWGAILLYITPTKNTFLELFNSSIDAGSANIERILTGFNIDQQGIYLAVENNIGLFGNPYPLQNSESVVISFPKASASQEKTKQPQNSGRLYISPPGEALCRMFEKQIERSFLRINLNQFKQILPILLAKDLKFAETVDIQIRGNVVTIEILNNFFEPLCQETANQPKTHKLVGCLLTSAIATALAKVTHKPITIKNELLNEETKTTTVQYQIMEKIEE